MAVVVRAARPAARAPEVRSRSRVRLSATELAQWFRQLAALLRAGVPLVAALDNPAARAVVRRAAVRARLREIGRDVESGSSFAQALARHPSLFDGFAVQIVVAGEAAGSLDESLLRIALRAERIASLRATVRRALLYPTIVIAVATVAVALLLVVVVPVFAEIFAEFGETLPLPTLFIVRLSEWTVRMGPYAVPLGAALVGIAVALGRRPNLHDRWDGWLLRMPVAGGIVRAAAVAQATETLAALVRGGVPVFDALLIASGTAGNAEIARALDGARQAVGSGHPLAGGLARYPAFPSSTAAMIAVGEESGGLDTMLESAAALAREEAERGVATVLSLLEPAIVLGLAVVVGFVVLAMYLPIFRLGSVIQ